MRDLFRRTFSRVSKFDYDDYYQEFVQRAPFCLLRAAAIAHDDVECVPGFRELYLFLRDNSHMCWSNPELYPHLFRILRARDLESNVERSLRALGAHLRLWEVDAAIFTHRYFRLHRPSPLTLELVNDDIHVVDDSVLAVEMAFPIVYLPLPHLFDDVVGGAATYVGSPLPIAPLEMTRLIRVAADVLREYDVGLYSGFIETVGTLAITGERHHGNRSSYSAGSMYTGGIFTSLCADSPILLVESFIHEYYHQRLWLWWLIEAPRDMPDRRLTMVSPVSKQERPVQVMMQALLIYISLTDYYLWVDRSAVDGADWVGLRWRSLQSGAAELLSTLRSVLVGRSESLRFIDAVAEYASWS
jgi:hypothetical protein